MLLLETVTGSVVADESQSVNVTISCGPAVVNQTWQMATGYIGAVLMLLIAVYARYSQLTLWILISKVYYLSAVPRSHSTTNTHLSEVFF